MSMHMKTVRGIVAVRADAGDVTKILADLQKDWSAFKETQAAKDKEVNAKFDDVVTTEKLARIDASVSELQASVDAFNAKIEAAKLGGGSDVADKEYSDAFRAHFKKGEISANLNKGADADGGYLAPVEWDRTITDALVQISQMRQIATVETISIAGYSKLFNLKGATSGWVGETDARPATDTPQFATMAVGTGELYANPFATQQMLDDSVINLENWLAGEIQEEFALREGEAFIAGNGTNKPFGFLTYITGAANAARNPLGAIGVNTAAATAAVTEDELLDLIYSLPSEYTGNARWVMNRTTMGKIRKLRDADGRQLWQPSSQAGQPSSLLNYALTEMPGMPTMAAGASAIAFGDFKRGYRVVDRTGVRVLRDPYTNKPHVGFYTTKRVGGYVADPRVIKVLKQAAS